MTHSAFAVVTCLFECSNRTATGSSSGLTVQGVRAALQIRMRSEDLLSNYDSLNMAGGIPWINTCLSSKGVIKGLNLGFSSGMITVLFI